MRTSAFTLLAMTLSLCASESVLAGTPPLAERPKGQLSDANLFEVHLHKPAAGHKRLPSEILRNHHERDELAENEDEDEGEEIVATAAPASVTAALTYGPTSTAAVVSSTNSLSATAIPQITFSPRQPSHFIKHRRQRHAKRRLSEAQFVLQAQEILAEIAGGAESLKDAAAPSHSSPAAASNADSTRAEGELGGLR